MSTKTIGSWISLLETSYIVFLLQPYYKNFSKRVVKSPKLFFYDTGLVCQLLGIRTHERLATDHLRGNIFESFIMSELQKKYYNQGHQPAMYFWRDKHGHEIDCIIDRDSQMIPIEIKSGMSVSSSSFQGLSYWNNLTKNDPAHGIVVYGGDEEQYRQKGRAVSWKALDTVNV